MIELWGGSRDGELVELPQPWPSRVAIPSPPNWGAPIPMERITSSTSNVPDELEVEVYQRAKFVVSRHGQPLPREKLALAGQLERFVKWVTTDAREPPLEPA